VIEVKKKILGFALAFVFLSMLATPMVSAKPTIKSVAFRIESWPAPTEVGDYSKMKAITAGESGNSKLLRLPTLGVPPLVDDVPEDDPAVWIPLLFVARGGVRLTIDGMGTREGTVDQMIIHSNTFADGSASDNQKWTFTFAEGTLEVSVKTDKNGMGKCVGTRGTGIFEGAKFTGTFEVNLYWYYLAAFDLWAGFTIQEGTGEIMFT
jgi:hypothetical protein